MTEGTLIKWHKKIGDSVEIGDILAEIETDKATMEMEAFDDGIITDILIQEGERAPIGGVLAVLERRFRKLRPIPAPQAVASAPAAAAPVQHRNSCGFNRFSKPFRRASQGFPSRPQNRRGSWCQSHRDFRIRTCGPDCQKRHSSRRKLLSQDRPPHPRPKHPPPPRLPRPSNRRPPLPHTAPTPTPAPAIIPVAKEGDERIELSSMRKIIASRLLTSKTTIPHFYLHLEVDAAPLMELRKQVNAQAEKTHGNKYSVNDFILKAVINATQTVPAVNASFAGDHIISFKHVGLSVAIAVEDGLVTPVIKQAETKSLLPFPARSRISPSAPRTKSSSLTNSTAAPSPFPTLEPGESNPSTPSSIHRKRPSCPWARRLKNLSSRTARSFPDCA